LQKSDRDVADLSAIRDEPAANVKLPQTTSDRYGYLQLLNGCEVETPSITSHITCTQPDGLYVAQQSLSNYEISPYDITVGLVEQVGSEVSGSSITDNTCHQDHVRIDLIYKINY
jgi:hypothetical protein